MRPDRVRGGRLALAGLTVTQLLNLAHAQTQAVAQSNRVQPYVELRSVATDNVNNAVASGKRKDLINTITPGISVLTRGPALQVSGDIQVTQVNYVRNSQPDRLLPKGAMAAHLGAERDLFGMDVSADIAQTRSTFAQTLGNEASTLDTYTDYRLRLSPSWNQHFGPLTELKARAEHSWLVSEGNSAQLAQRPNSQADTVTLQVRRTPTPLGADLSGEAQRSQVNGQSQPALERQALRAGLSYAPAPELEIGLILGTEHTAVPLNSTSDPIRGWRIRFRPIERSLLEAQVESHGYGQTWQGAISHRNPSFSLSIQTRRSADTSTTSLGRTAAGMSLRDALDAMLTSRYASPTERSQAVDTLMSQRKLGIGDTSSRDLYDLSAQLREVTSGRLALLGKHNMLSLTAGLNRTRPLSLGSSDALSLLPSTRTKEYFVDTQYTQDLGPLSKWAVGARWSKASTQALTNGISTSTLTREFAWTSAIDWRLSAQANLTLGLRQLTSHKDAKTNTVSNELYGGLGYRF